MFHRFLKGLGQMIEIGNNISTCLNNRNGQKIVFLIIPIPFRYVKKGIHIVIVTKCCIRQT